MNKKSIGINSLFIHFLKITNLHNSFTLLRWMTSYMIGTIALPLQKYFNMVYQYFVKPCHAEFILGNMKICWHFLSFLNIWMVRLLEILSCGRQGLTYPAWSRTWLLMTWSGKESEQQQSWFRLSLPGIFWSLQWRHNELDGVSNHQPHDCLPGTDQRIIKVPRHWPLWGEFTGDQWIPRTKGQ